MLKRLLCEQIDNEGFSCDEPAVTTFNGIPLCAKCYESVVGEPYVDEEEDISEKDIRDMEEERGER